MPSPAPTLRSTATVYLAMAGAVEDYSAAVLSSIGGAIAAELQIAASLVTVAIQAGSVLLRVELPDYSRADLESRVQAGRLSTLAGNAVESIFSMLPVWTRAPVRQTAAPVRAVLEPGAACSGTVVLTAMSGTFSDGPANYLPNMQCVWRLSAADAITLSFSLFSTEAGYDFLKVYDGGSERSPLLGSFSGSQIPSAVSATSGSMYVAFSTDGSVQSSGFSAQFS